MSIGIGPSNDGIWPYHSVRNEIKDVGIPEEVEDSLGADLQRVNAITGPVINNSMSWLLRKSNGAELGSYLLKLRDLNKRAAQ